jgi:DNA-binding NtrC family response regulator
MSDKEPMKMKNRVLVLSDNDVLALVIALALSTCLGADSVRLNLSAAEQWQESFSANNFDLIIVGISVPVEEVQPVLSKAFCHVPETPVLIVSDRPVSTFPAGCVDHLEFPFDIDALCGKAEEMLGRVPKL